MSVVVSADVWYVPVQPYYFAKSGFLIGGHASSRIGGGYSYVHWDGRTQVFQPEGDYFFSYASVDGTNATGALCGSYYYTDDQSVDHQRPFGWRSGKVTMLGSPQGEGSANSINDTNDIAGAVQVGSSYVPALWRSRNWGKAIVLSQLPGYARKVTTGRLVEFRTTALRSYLWKDGTVIDPLQYVDPAVFDGYRIVSENVRILTDAGDLLIQASGKNPSTNANRYWTGVVWKGVTKRISGNPVSLLKWNESGDLIYGKGKGYYLLRGGRTLVELSGLPGVTKRKTFHVQNLTDSGYILFRTYDSADGQYVGSWYVYSPDGRVFDLGDVEPLSVGESGHVVGVKGSQGFDWANGTFTNLNGLIPLSVNSSGDVAGTYHYLNGLYRSFLIRNGVVSDLGIDQNDSFGQPLDSEATLVNEDGKAAGNIFDGDGYDEFYTNQFVRGGFTATEPVMSAAFDSYDAYQGGWLVVKLKQGVLANDRLVHLASLAIGPSHGQVTLHPDGSFVYRPDAGYTGPDAFSYIAGNGSDTSAPAMVWLDVRANAAPVPNAGPDSIVAATGDLTPVTVTGTATDADNATESLRLSWRANGLTIRGAQVTFNLPKGRHRMQLAATDPHGANGYDSMIVTVR